ncbi:MAG TPA: hypothetical protein EYQ54_21980 [Myxococcales bacterium]|nr:hypothetical protein [Myxococcales bacterium]
MTGALALIGIVLAAFGWASQQALGELTPFALGQGLVGGAALVASALSALMRAGRNAQPALRRPMLGVLGRAAGVCALAVALYAAAGRSDLRLDWTFEGRYSLSEASLALLARLPEPLVLTLYSATGDPRIRHTRALLDEFARHGEVEVRTRALEQFPEDEDRFGIGSSNSVVASLGTRWELVQRPGEGSLYEAIAGLEGQPERILYTAVGAGEGDLWRSGAEGYSGLGAALATEGYRVRRLPLAVADAIPPDAAGLLVVAPERPLPDAALGAIERFVDGGGALVVFLEPGHNSGLESVLARYGLESPDRWVVDPASIALEGETLGLAPVASAYSDHPSTHGLNPNRMTFFRGARAFALHKARPDDRLRGVVHTSADAWTDPWAGNLEPGATPIPPPDARPDYHALVAVAEIERGAGRARIAAFGDADLASNRYLRALYNLDLVINTVHWALAREPAIALHPKSGGRQLNQFPVPLEKSLQSLYGAGLLIPELLLIVGGLVWLRQRNA